MADFRPEGSQVALKMFYGNPDSNGDGQPDPKWEADNLVYIDPPYPMKFSWGPVCKKIRVHKKCAKPLLDSLTEIGETFNPSLRAKYQLNQTGGCYNFRLMRGSYKTLSVHSYGAAFDIAPLLNPLGQVYNPNRDMLPKEVVDIFAKHGFIWGGKWKRPDAMHVQWTRPV